MKPTTKTPPQPQQTTQQITTPRPEFELLEDGRIVHNKRGQQTNLAKFDFDDGHLEFGSPIIQDKFSVQITRAITEDTEGMLTNNKIVSLGIAGRPRDEVKDNEPPRPKMKRTLGDKTPEVVNWYFKHRRQEFYARYGVYLDKRGEPLRAHCLRIDKTLGEVDPKGNIGQIEEVVEDENGMLALRATHRTFTRKEIKGGDPEEADDAEANNNSDE